MKRLAAILVLTVLVASRTVAQESYYQIPPDSNGKKIKTFLSGGIHTPISILYTTGGAEAGTVSSPLQVALASALPAGSSVIGAVTQSGSWTVGVSGPVAVTGTFWQATQPVSGSLGRSWTLGSGTDTVSASVTNWPATVAVTGTFWQTTQPVSGPLTDAQLRASAVPVSGTFWQATQPVSGTFWQSTQPVSAASLPLPSGAATETTLAAIKTDVDKIPSSPATDRATAAAPFSMRLSDGAAFYKATTPSDTQPVSAVSWPLPTGASTEATLAAIQGRLPSALGSGGGLQVECIAGCGGSGSGGGTSSTYGAAFPAAGTAAGFNDASGNMRGARVYDIDSGAGTEHAVGVVLRKTGNGGSTEIDPTQIRVLTSSDTVTTVPPANASTNVAQVNGTTIDTNSGSKSAGTVRVVLATDQPQLTNAMKVDGSATTQPVSGTVTANLGTLNGAATAANQTTGNSSLSSIDGKLATAKTADLDTGAGTDTVQLVGVALPKSGGAVAGGTSSDPIRIDPTGTTTQPISDSAGNTKLDTLHTDLTTSGGGAYVRQDSTATIAKESGGNLASIKTNSDTLAGAVTSSKVQTNTAQMGGASVATADYDSGAGTVTTPMVGISLPASGGPVAGGTSSNPVRTDPTGTTTQPVSIASAVPITDNSGSLTVDAPVGTPVFVRLSDGASPISTLPVSLAAAVATNADGTTGSAVPSKGLLVQGSDGTNARNISTTTAGVVKVDLSATAANGTAVKVDGSAVTQPANVSQINGVTPLMGNGVTGTGSQRVTIASDNSDLPFKAATVTATTGTFTNATQTNSVTTGDITGYPFVVVTITGTYGTATAVFEISDDGGTTWYAALGTRSDSATSELGYTSLSNTSRMWDIGVAGTNKFRVRSTAVASGTVNVRITPTNVPIEPAPTVTLAASSATIGALSANQSVNVAQVAGTTTDTNSGNKSAGTIRVVLATDQPALSTAMPTSVADGSLTTLGTKADAKSTATDTTAVSAMSVLKQISASVQAPPSQPVTNAGTFAVQAASAGDVAHDTADSGNPVKVGGQARTTLPTAVADADRANLTVDKFGRTIVQNSIRALRSVQKTTITSSTTETTIVTAGGAGVFLDLYGLILTNTSATATKVTIKDATAGTTRAIFQVPAGETRGYMLPAGDGIPQATANNNWTATCGTSVASLEVTALYVQEK